MTTKPDYITELEELIEEYGVDKLAGILKVSPRAIGYWIAGEGAKVPRKDMRRTIHELFMNRKEGQEPAKNGVTHDFREDREGMTSKALLNLTQTNLNISESQKSLAKSNEDLVGLLTRKLSEDAGKQMNEDFGATLAVLLGYVADVVARVQKKDVNEIESNIHKEILMVKQKQSKKGIRV